MKLIYIGHACFKIESGENSLIVDPYSDGSVPGLKNIRETANEVLCSHEHADHNARETVSLMKTDRTVFQIEVIPSYHDEEFGAKRGSNQIYIIDDGETRMAHLGDQGCDLEADQIGKLKNLDVLLIPVGGYYTISGTKAAEIVSKLKPKCVIPMHYRDDQKKFGYEEISTVGEFTENLDHVMTSDGSEWSSEEPCSSQVLVLTPLNRKNP